MLNICEIGHEPVCYEGAYCPACKLADELRARIDKLQDEVDIFELIEQRKINAKMNLKLTRQERENRRELKEYPYK